VSDHPNTSPPPPHIAVIGGGPAGLRAAEVAAQGGASVTLFEARQAVGRKFLIAGKNGLNLTNAEDFDLFLSRYHLAPNATENWQRILRAFDADALIAWAAGLDTPTFVASGGKVLPTSAGGKLNSTPLLRRWIARLHELGVQFQPGHRWTGFGAGKTLRFERAGSTVEHAFDAAILALGGASWPRTGSDGKWTNILGEQGVRIEPLRASNCGWETPWPTALLEEAEGLPLKNLLVSAGTSHRRGELVITRYGLEGGPIYRLGPAIRDMDDPHLVIDFKPDQTHEQLLARLGNVQRNFVREAARRLNLDAGTRALLKHLPDRGPWKAASQLALELKHCRIPLTGPRPIAEAISSAGGIHWDELESNLMLRRFPGVFVAGEMIDWDAPTGGYLLQACFATGTCAGRAALAHAAL